MTTAVCVECGAISKLNSQGQAIIHHKKSCSESGLYEWHYLRKGEATHARHRQGAGLDFVARCGAYPDMLVSSDWYGTGSQDEYENARARPKCKRCLKLIDGAT